MVEFRLSIFYSPQFIRGRSLDFDLGKVIAYQNPHHFSGNRRGQGRTPLTRFSKTQQMQLMYDAIYAIGQAADSDPNRLFAGERVGDWSL